jgi:hypothetical protein
MEDWVGKLLGALAVFFLLVPPRWDPMILWKERLEDWPKRDHPEWEPDRGWGNGAWSLFVAAIAVIVMLAVVFAISVSS